MLYPIVLAIYSWCSGTDPVYYANPTLAHFSQSYCALALAVGLIILSSKKDLSFFMRIGSLGVIFIMLFVLYIVYNFFLAVENTSYSLGTEA